LGNDDLLITFTAVVAAEKSLASFLPNLPKFMIPSFAIVVAILTAFDQTTKPGTRWRLSAGYATKFRGLKTKTLIVDPTDRAAIAQMNEEFQALDEKWLNDTTF
jgi:hypothetical protein